MAAFFLATLLLSQPLAGVPGLTIEPQGPEPRCPSAVEVSAALQAHGLATGVSGGGWTLSYGADASTVHLRLRDPAGRAQLDRSVALSRSACADVASLFAAIVERYFVQIGWTAGTPLPSAAADVASVPARPLERLRVSAGPALLTGDDRKLRAAVDVRWRIVGPLVLALGTFAPGDRAAMELPAEASAERTGWPVRFGAGLGRSFGERFAIEAGADTLWSDETGRTVRAPSTGSARRLVVDLGASVAASLRLASRWHLVADAAGWRALGSEFAVQMDGGSRRVLTIPSWRFVASLRLAFVIWP